MHRGQDNDKGILMSYHKQQVGYYEVGQNFKRRLDKTKTRIWTGQGDPKLCER